MKNKKLVRNSVTVVAMSSLIAACATSGHRYPAGGPGQGPGPGGAWNRPIPWGGGQQAGGDWGNQIDPDVYNNPDAHVNQYIHDTCNQIVPQNGPAASNKHKSHRNIASLQNQGQQGGPPGGQQGPGQPGNGQQNPRPGQPGQQPGHPQPQPGQPNPVAPAPVAPAPVAPAPGQPPQAGPVAPPAPPAPPAFDRLAAIQQCEAGRNEAVQQARQSTQWLGVTQGFLSAFDNGRHDGQVAADPSQYGQGYQVWANQKSADATARGQSVGSPAGQSQAVSDVVGTFVAATSASGGPVPPSNPPTTFNVSFAGYSSGWTDSGHPAPDYSVIMQGWVDNNISSLNLPDGPNMGGHFQYGVAPLDSSHFKAYWNDDGVWNLGYTYQLDRPMWDDYNDGWNNYSHAQNGTYFVQGYQAVYQQAAEFYYRVSFYQGANRGNPYGNGYNAGKFVQETYNEQTGEMAGFDFIYQRDSAAGYQTGYASGYQTGYQATYQDYANNPKVSYSLTSLTSSDGSFVSGADVSALIHLVNNGGAAAQLTITSTGLGPSSSGATSASLTANALQLTDQTTAAIGAIPQGYINGQSDSIAIDVQQIAGASTVDLGNQSVTEVLDSWAELSSTVSWLTPYDSFMQGKANFQVAVQNPLKATTPGNIDLVATLASQEIGRLHLGQLSGGQSTTVTIPVSGLDPVQVLSGLVSVSFRVEMADGAQQPTVTSTASSTLGFPVDTTQPPKVMYTTRSHWAALYFDSLVTSGASQTQMTAASNMVSSFVTDEVNTANSVDTNLWGNSDSSQETLIVQLGNIYQATQNKSAAYSAAYEALGDSLIGKSAGNGIQPHGIFGRWNNRNGYQNAVKRFAPSVHMP